MKYKEADVDNLVVSVQKYIEGIYDGSEDARLDGNIERLCVALDRILGDQEGWVYVFRILESDVVKIGFTTRDPKDRLAEVQAGLPHILEIALVLRGSYNLESELHARFKGYRIRGEWFLAHDSLNDWLCDNNARGFGFGRQSIVNPFPWGPDITGRGFADQLYKKRVKTTFSRRRSD